MVVTGLGLISAALKDLGVLALGQTPTGAESDDALETLNHLADFLGLDRPLLYASTRTEVDLTANVPSYLIGTDATIDLERPDFIDSACVVLDDTATTPVETPIGVLSREQWAVWPMKDLTANAPRAIYYDKAFVGGLLNGLIYVLPIPDVDTAQLVLYTPGGQLAEFDQTTEVIVPRGWAAMLRANLAVALKPGYPAAVLDPIVKWQASQTRKAIHNATISIPMQQADPALTGGSGARWDINSATWVR